MYMVEQNEYPILYKKNSKHIVSKWKIHVEKIGEIYSIISTFGLALEGSKQQIHTRIIEKGKANRSIFQQAHLEAKSKWNEKKQRDTYTEIVDIPTTVVRPMLAHSFDKDLYSIENKSRAFKLNFPVFVQRKFDGIRCMTHMESNGNVVMESRKGMLFDNFTFIKTCLKMHLIEYPNLYFDGELYTKDIPFETISGLVRLKEKNSSKEQLLSIESIEYHIYDVYDPTNPSWEFNERIDFLKRISRNHSSNKIIFVDTDCATNILEIKAKHDLYVHEGFEGLIIRDFKGPYEQNKRSKYLQKYKEFMEEEFIITGYHDGEGHDKGMVIWECVTKSGKHFSAKPQGSFEERKRMFLIASTFVGRQLTVVFQELTVDGIPRFPVGKGIRDGY
jgi:ATP-dependent DNA ligase